MDLPITSLNTDENSVTYYLHHWWQQCYTSDDGSSIYITDDSNVTYITDDSNFTYITVVSVIDITDDSNVTLLMTT